MYCMLWAALLNLLKQETFARPFLSQPQNSSLEEFHFSFTQKTFSSQ